MPADSAPRQNPANGAAVGSKMVAVPFQANYHPSPIHDPITMRLVFILQRQLKGYTNQDPDEKPQNALTLCILWALIAICGTTLDKAISQLAVGIFFFAMHSCKYSKVPQPEEHCIKLLVMYNICFF